jgi:hypothetical protein
LFRPIIDIVPGLTAIVDCAMALALVGVLPGKLAAGKMQSVWSVPVKVSVALAGCH